MLKAIKGFLSKNKLYPLFLVPIGLILSLLAGSFPNATENIFSQGIYPIISRLVGSIISFVPFSVFEMLIIFLIFAAVILAISMLIGGAAIIMRLIKKSGQKNPGDEAPQNAVVHGGKKQNVFVKIAFRILSGASIVYFIFVIFCGLNYYRLEFAELSGLDPKPSTERELVLLCEELISQANEQKKNVLSDSNGATQLSHELEDVAHQAKISINSLNKKYDYIFWADIKPKFVLNSKAMSYMNITGVFSPFTIEANVNTDITDYDIPATMCHELVHTRGFMREDEANFIAYLACKDSTDIDFQYSGTMLALVHSMNRLYDADSDKYFRLNSRYSEGVQADFEANSQYWKQFEGKIADVSSQVNDTYLKANSQADGVVSYGRMVDLLLAERRKRK